LLRLNVRLRPNREQNSPENQFHGGSAICLRFQPIDATPNL
jgi:hypothetical protein